MPISPILPSGLELLDHAIEHLRKGTPRDLRLAVIHADNALELGLKEIVRFNGMRIIDRKGHSVGYYDCINRLQSGSISMPELPDIDVLHTVRNSIYHLGSQPDRRRAEWLVLGVALNFIKRVCADELGYDISQFSERSDRFALMNKEIEAERKAIVEKYLSESVWAHDNNMYNDCVISSYAGIEAYLGNAIPIDIRSRPDMLRTLVEDELLDQETVDEIMRLRQIRNRAVHGATNATMKESESALKLFKLILYVINSVLM